MNIPDTILKKLENHSRLSVDDAEFLYENADLSELAVYADTFKRKLNSDLVYFINNYHIEPTNVCVYQCRFCSFSAREGITAWSKSVEEILEEVRSLDESITELHIVGGSNPQYDLKFYSQLLRQIKETKPNIHIKAFTAAEVSYFAQLSKTSSAEVIRELKASGLDSMPGGGAEIFNETVRNQICPDKISGQRWLEIHEEAHQEGLTTNATMLFGHLETIRHRIEHMELLRSLQDKTRGFQAFIPLKFRNSNNQLSNIKESGATDDLKLFALSRLFLDNINHIKIYWPAFGKNFASLALGFGADDLDGTILNSTKIYSMAGAEDQHPEMTVTEAIHLIKSCGFQAVLRDSKYNILMRY